MLPALTLSLLQGLQDDGQVGEEDSVEREEKGFGEGHVVVRVDAHVLQAVVEDLDLGGQSGVVLGQRVLVEEDAALEKNRFPDFSRSV